MWDAAFLVPVRRHHLGVKLTMVCSRLSAKSKKRDGLKARTSIMLFIFSFIIYLLMQSKNCRKKKKTLLFRDRKNAHATLHTVSVKLIGFNRSKIILSASILMTYSRLIQGFVLDSMYTIQYEYIFISKWLLWTSLWEFLILELRVGGAARHHDKDWICL